MEGEQADINVYVRLRTHSLPFYIFAPVKFKLMAMQNLENNLRGAELRGICREKNGLQVELDYSDLNR